MKAKYIGSGKYVLPFFLIAILVLSGCVGQPPSPTPTPTPTATASPTATPTASPTPTGPPIKIALVAPLTGPAARTGEQYKDAILFTYNELKAQGKIPVYVDGKLRDIQFIWVDSKSDPEEAVKAYEDAIVRLGADILGGNWHSSVAMALYKISTRYHKIHWGSVGETQFLCYKRIKNPDESKYWFKLWPCPPIYASLFVPAFQEVLKDAGYTPRNKKVALLVEDTDYGRGMGDALKAAFEKAGWQVVYYDVFTLSPPETDFTPLISKYKSADISLVYQVSTGLPSLTAFLKQVHEMKLKAFVASFGIGWFSVDEWYPAVGEASDYVLSMDATAVLTDEQKAWVNKYKAQLGYTPSAVVCGYWAHDQFSMLIDALNKAGSMDPDKIRAALLSMDYKGLFMNIKICDKINCTDASGRLIGHFQETVADAQHFHFPLLQWKGGQSKPIWPADVAEAKLEIPPILKG